jgi:hypothetical protein
VFAHTEGFLNFDSPEITAMLPPATEDPSKLEPIKEFLLLAGTIESALNAASGLPDRGLIKKIDDER